MPTSVYHKLAHWARRTTSFARERAHGSETEIEAGDSRIYRLRRWPDLAHPNADVFRALSVMSHRPVNRHWLLSNSRLDAEQVDSLLEGLVAQGAVDVVDASAFPADALTK